MASGTIKAPVTSWIQPLRRVTVHAPVRPHLRLGGLLNYYYGAGRRSAGRSFRTGRARSPIHEAASVRGWRSCKPPLLRQPHSQKPQRISDLRGSQSAMNVEAGANWEHLRGGRLRRPHTSDRIFRRNLEAPPGFESGIEVLQTSSAHRFGRRSAYSLSVSAVLLRPDPPETARQRLARWLAEAPDFRIGAIPLVGQAEPRAAIHRIGSSTARRTTSWRSTARATRHSTFFTTCRRKLSRRSLERRDRA
jgi:hypothetical protein